jgi:spermidine dehydrogenase
MTAEDRDLGMNRAISRRDFVNGVAVAAGSSAIAPALAETARSSPAAAGAVSAANYPPMRHGMRGDHPGSFESAPAMRKVMGLDPTLPAATNTGETYDLVVAGAGLSGLAAAWYYREKAGPNARILILDNHDDFGGHAKRNEYHYQGQTFFVPGGSVFMIDTTTWPYDATRLVRQLGFDISSSNRRPGKFVAAGKGLGAATFFHKAAYGKDVLVHGGTPRRPTPGFLAQAPLDARVKSDLDRLMNDAKTDYLPGLSVDQKIAKLRSISYRDYLLNYVKVHPDVLHYAHGVWCLSNDTVSAWFAYFRYSPGFAGLGVPRPAGSPESPWHENHNYWEPGGNHDIARMIVRSLIPDALPKGNWLDVETVPTNYAALDRQGQPARLRLSSMVVRARHVGTLPHQFEPDNREVEVTYVKGGKAYTVRAKDVVMAGFNVMIPYICPELPEEQKKALHMSVRAINLSTNVLLRNWEAFAKLRVSSVAYPQAFYDSFRLGSTAWGAKEPQDPSQPVLLSFNGGTGLASEFLCKDLLGGKLPPPGTPVREQMRLVRAGLLKTPFERFERAIRTQAATALAGSGFDPARDIVDITLNRWGHGYALGRNALFDDEKGPGYNVIGRKKFGHITIANSDASGIDNAQTAMDEGARAVRELEPRNYGYYESI